MTGYRHLALLGAGALTLAGVALAAPVQAVVPPGAPVGAPLDVVAIGDSYTAGLGGSAPLPAPDAACRRTSTGYASVLTQTLRESLATPVDLSLVACSGATTLSTRTGSDTSLGLSGAPRAITGPQQVAAVDADTDLVVLTAGAGDTDLEAILAACLLSGDTACATAAGTGVAFYNPATLVELLAAVDAAAGPRAPQDRLLIRVSGYVQPYDLEGIAEGSCTSVLSPSVLSATSINNGVVALNSAIAGATVQAAGAARNSDIGFVAVDERFAGHRVCDPEPWLLEPTLATVAARSALHPTDAGHAAYAAAVLSQPVELAPLLAGRTVPVPTATTTSAPTTTAVTATTGTTTSTTSTVGTTTSTTSATTSTTSATTGTTAAGTVVPGTSSVNVTATTAPRTTAVATSRPAAAALSTTGATVAPLVALGSILVLGGAAATGLTRRRTHPRRAG